MSEPRGTYHGGPSCVQSSDAEIRPLGSILLDTVELIGNGEIASRAHGALLALWESRVAGGDTGEVEVAGLAPSARVSVRAKSDAFPLMLSTPHWRAQVNYLTGKAKLTLAASTLLAEGPAWAIAEAKRIAWWLWEGRTVWTVQRIDLAADFIGTHVHDYADTTYCVRRARVVTKHRSDKVEVLTDIEDVPDAERVQERAGDVVTREDYRAVTSVTMGSAGSGVQVCIYDKTKQTAECGIEWARESMRQRGWDGEETVTRVEVRYRNRALDDFPAYELRKLESLNDFAKWCGDMWRYGTCKAVRYCERGRDSNRSRWETRDDWRAIADAASVRVIAERRRYVRQSIRDERRRRASRDLVRAVERLAAESSHTLAHAQRLVGDAIAGGTSELVAMLAAVLASEVDVLTRAMPRVRPQDRGAEMLARARARHVYNTWQDDAYYAMSACDEPRDTRQIDQAA